MKVLCNKATKRIEGFSRWDDIEHNSSTHVVVTTLEAPDQELDRLNNAGTGIRASTQAERDVDTDREFNSTVDTELKTMYVSLLDDFFDYINSKPDAPQNIKDKADEILAKRATRKP